jgi:putative membrane protein
MALAGVAWAGAAAALLARPLTRHVLGAVERHGQRRVSWFALGVIVALVAGMTGWRGMSVALVAAGIGLIPPLFGARRMNCLGVILLPIACNLSGIGPGIARWLRLL